MSKKKKKKKNKKYYSRVFWISLLSFLVILAVTRRIIYRDKLVEEDVVTPPAPVMEYRTEPANESETVVTEPPTEPPTEAPKTYPFVTENTQNIDESLYDAEHSILFDMETYEVIAGKDAFAMMYPASLTKIMTLIVAAENASDINATVEISEEMLSELNAQGASVAGFYAYETPTLEDTLYAMIMSSGADAAIAVAECVAGSQEAFINLMNDKAVELGLQSTHFTNVTGLHENNHYSSAADMGTVLAYAYNIPFCRQVLSTNAYNTSPTDLHPDGMYLESTLSNHLWGMEKEGVNILGGKTGFTDQAGYCIASVAEVNGKLYAQIYAGSYSYWNAADGSLEIYSQYCNQ